MTIELRETGKNPNECRGHYLRRYLREYNDVTGIHGVRYTTEKRSRAEKIVWIILLLISLGGCIYMTYEVLYKYYNSPIVVSLATEDTPIFEIPFPAITVCPEAKYSRENFNYSKIYLDLLDGVVPEDIEISTIFSHLSLICNNPSLEITSEVFESQKILGDEVYETINDFQIDPTTMFLACSFAGQQFNCTDKFVPIITDSGICYTFNMLDRNEIFRDHVATFKNYHIANKSIDFDIEKGYSENAPLDVYPQRVLNSGTDEAFILFLDYNISQTDYSCNDYVQGFRIVIHNPWDLPRPDEHHIKVPLRKFVSIAMEPDMITTSDTVRKFDPSKRKCLMKDERPLKHFKMYTQRNCLLECFANHYLNKCGCVLYYMPRDKNTSICGLGKFKCIDESYDDLKLKAIQSKLKNSDFCDCKPGCFDMKINSEISSSDLYFDEFFKMHKKFFDKDESRDSNMVTSVVGIYFKHEQFIPKERSELYGISDLISNLGGLLGLFTGFSLISMAEIIYFCSLRICCNQRMYGYWYGPAE